MKDEKNPFIAARATGIPHIAEGRIFLLVQGAYRAGDLIPQRFRRNFSEKGISYTAYVADDEMPVVCWCGVFLEKYRPASYYPDWMCMVSRCPHHRQVLWVDYFPKARGFSAAPDYVNMLPRYLDGAKRLYLDPEGLEIIGSSGPSVLFSPTGIELYRRWYKSAPVEFLLTVDGLVSATGVFRSGIRKFFFPKKS